MQTMSWYIPISGVLCGFVYQHCVQAVWRNYWELSGKRELQYKVEKKYKKTTLHLLQVLYIVVLFSFFSAIIPLFACFYLCLGSVLFMGSSLFKMNFCSNVFPRIWYQQLRRCHVVNISCIQCYSHETFHVSALPIYLFTYTVY